MLRRSQGTIVRSGDGLRDRYWERMGFFTSTQGRSSYRLWMAAGACLLLANCASSDKFASRVDPKYGVSSSPRVVEFDQPVPKGGGTYRIGKPYVVGGRTYVPEEDPNYRAEGLASWYGDDFHGRLTANGEVFDMTSLTAAHPTLPLPCYVRVTNMGNGKSLIVRVNDRGPYHGNRVLDVSHRAATLLDFQTSGVARVRVEYVGRAPLEGSDDRMLVATLRSNEPAPAPSGVRIASASSFVPAMPSGRGTWRGDVPMPMERPYSLGNTQEDAVAAGPSEVSSRRATRAGRGDDSGPSVDASPDVALYRPISSYAPASADTVGDPTSARGLY